MKPTYEELEAKCLALAAENAGLKSNLMFWDAEDPEAPYDCPEEIAENCQMDFNTEFDVQVAARMPNRTYRVCEITEFERSIELVGGGEVETPATDDFLAEVRAQGLERLAKAWYAIANETAPGISISESSRLKYRQRADDVADFANEIRKEAAQ